MKRNIVKITCSLLGALLFIACAKSGNVFNSKVQAIDYGPLTSRELSQSEWEKQNNLGTQEDNQEYYTYPDGTKYYYNGNYYLYPDGTKQYLDTEIDAQEYFTKAADWYTLTPDEGITSNNTLSIKWYKKAHIRDCWPNTDFSASIGDYSTVFPVSQDQNNWSAASFRVKSMVLGKATLNGRKYYVVYSGKMYISDKLTDGTFRYVYTNGHPKKMQISLIPTTSFDNPKLVKVTHKIGSVYYLYADDKEITISKLIHTWLTPKEVIMIPSHHQVVELSGVKYIPIIWPDSRCLVDGGLIKYSDYRKYVSHPKNAKMMFNYEWAKQKNGHVSLQFYENKDKKEFYKTVGWVNSYLKSSKQKKNAQKQLLNTINKEYKKYKKLGLTTR